MKRNPDLNKNLYPRLAPIRIASRDNDSGEAQSEFDAVLSTEQPVTMFDWDRFRYIPEILRADGVEIPGSAQVPLLDSHMRYSVETQLGSVRSVKSEKNEVVGTLSFDTGDERAMKAAGKVERKHVTDVSVGYERLASVYIEPGETAKVEGEEYTAGSEGLVITTKWRLLEGSITPIGADDQAKIRGYKSIEDARKKHQDDMKRSRNQNQPETPPNTAPEGGDTGRSSAATTQEPAQTQPSNPQRSQQGQGPDILSREDILREERERRSEIESIAGRYPWVTDEHVRSALEDGMSVDSFRTHVLNIFNPDAIAASGRDSGELGLSDREINQFSVRNAILARAHGNQLEGLEAECYRALRERYPDYEETNRSFLIPAEVAQHRALRGQEGQRTMTAGTAASAGNLIDTELRGIIEYCTEGTYLNQLGATFLTGLRDDLTFVRRTNQYTATWEAEEVALTGQDLTFDLLNLTPKRLGALGLYTLNLLRQQSWSIEALVREEFGLSLARGIDRGALFGTGGNAPSGLFTIAGTQAVTFGGAPTWADIVGFEQKLEESKCAGIESARWLGTPAVKAAWKTTEKAAGSNQGFLMERDNSVNGYPFVSGLDVSGDKATLGIWRHLMVAIWGAMEVIVDPYSQGEKAVVRSWAHAFADAAARHASAFVISSDAGNQP